MKHRWLGIVGAVLLVGTVPPTLVVAQTGAQTERGPYARIAILRPHDGDTVDFESGYIRHLEFHRQARDTWTWYGWTIWAGERQRWFVYATFAHSAASLDNPVTPAEDERDNLSNVTPHARFVGNALYEYLPGLSRGTGEPPPTARLRERAAPAAAGGRGHARDPSRRCRASGHRDGRRGARANTRGSFLTLADVSDRVRPGVVASTKGRWPGEAKGGATINATVDERDSDMGGGAVYHDNRVRVEKSGLVALTGMEPITS